MKITEIISNPNNPRIIKDDKFKKLVQSIKDFPQMLELRPIVINEENVILGGNMRLKACKEAGLTEVPVKIAKGLTKEQENEFIIKDNLPYGEWDFDVLGNLFDEVELLEFGFTELELGLSSFEVEEKKPKDPEQIECPLCHGTFEQ